MPVLKTYGHWKAGIYKVLQSVAASLLMLSKYKRYNCTDFLELITNTGTSSTLDWGTH